MRTATWVRITGTLQILTGLIHSLSLFIKPVGQNENERKMLELMRLPQEAGAGFHPSQWDMFIALSSCMTWLYLFAGILNWYLSKKNIDRSILKGIISIQVLILGAYFVVTTVLTFLFPIICTGVVFLSLLLTWSVIHKRQ